MMIQFLNMSDVPTFSSEDGDDDDFDRLPDEVEDLDKKSKCRKTAPKAPDDLVPHVS